MEIYDTFIGTGGDCYYISAFPEGDFGFQFAGSEFSVVYSDPFAYRYSFDATAMNFQASGNTQRLYFNSYVKDNGVTVQIASSGDLAFLNRAISEHNSGKVATWNSRMQLSYGYDTELGLGYIEIACPPNLTDEFMQSTLGLMNTSGRKLIVSQDFGGSVQVIPVSYKYDKSTVTVKATLEYTQPFVTYTLCLDDRTLESKIGNGKPLEFSTQAMSGYYHIKATYSEGGLNASADLEGIRYDSGMLSLDDEQNWILTRTFNYDNHGDAEEEQITYDVSYYDGLGYASQNVQIYASGDEQQNIVQPFAYDGLYREEFRYLPYVRDNDNGRYDDEAILIRRIFTERNMNWKRLLPVHMFIPNTNLRH